MDSYPDFYQLVEQDGESKRYFASLPNEMKQAVCSHPEDIHTFDSLRSCAENYLNNR